MAAVRCKRSKWVFLLAAFCGYNWKEDELFYPPDEVCIQRVQDIATSTETLALVPWTLVS